MDFVFEKEGYERTRLKEINDAIAYILSQVSPERLNEDETQSDLLERAFTAITHELDTAGPTQLVGNLSATYFQRLMAYCRKYYQEGVQVYRDRGGDGDTFAGIEYQRDVGETVAISILEGVADDEFILGIKRRTPRSEDEMEIAVSTRRRKLNTFSRRPHLKSEIATDFEEIPDISFDVYLQDGALASMQRKLFRSGEKGSYVTDMRTIEFPPKFSL